MKNRLKLLWLNCRHEMVLLLKNGNQADLNRHRRTLPLYGKLVQALQNYDPCHRDYVRGKLEQDTQSPEIIQQIARWATEVTMTIELMHEGHLPPDTLSPMIEPLELAYYYERLQTYKEWLFSSSKAAQRRALPFFYMVASERIYQQRQYELAMAQIEAVEEATFTLADWIPSIPELWPPAENEWATRLFVQSLLGGQRLALNYT